MQEKELISAVRRHFPYLFRRYAFEVIACSIYNTLDNWILVLRSPWAGRVLAMKDRGEVFLALAPVEDGPRATAGPWFDLAVVLEYLSEGLDMVESSGGSPDEQLARWSRVLRPYMEQISELFGTSRFDDARSALDSIGARREAELGD